MTVKAILAAKGAHIPTVSSGAKIRDVLQRLEEEDTGALVVMDNGATILGIISERDIVRGLRSVGDGALDYDVKELMTTEVVTCNAKDSITVVMAMMLVNRIRHIPVIEDGRLAGFVSIRDIIKTRLDEVQADGAAMQKYISG